MRSSFAVEEKTADVRGVVIRPLAPGDEDVVGSTVVQWDFSYAAD